MSTKIRPVVTNDGISKHRFYELKHFCLQYHEWEQQYQQLGLYLRSVDTTRVRTDGGDIEDHTANIAIMRATLKSKMDLVKQTALDTDPVIGLYIFKGCTDDIGYWDLNPPCSKELYYKLYHQFFNNLSSQKLQAL